MYRYNCVIQRVIDGDTVDVDIDLGFGIWQHKERVRIHGIDTPESRTRNKIEKKYGILSKKFVQTMLPKGSKQILVTEKPGDDAKGKFGRILGKFEVYDSTTDSYMFLGQIMVREGYAVEYHGQSKDDIQEAHLANRKKLQDSGII